MPLDNGKYNHPNKNTLINLRLIILVRNVNETNVNINFVNTMKCQYPGSELAIIL